MTPSKNKLNRAVSFIFGITAFAVLGSLVGDGFLYIVVLSGAMFFITLRVVTGGLRLRTPLDWAIGLLAFSLILTFWATDDMQTTGLQVSRIAAGIIFFYAITVWGITHERVISFGFYAVGLGVVLAAVTPFVIEWTQERFFFIPSSLYQNFPLLVSDSVHKNVMAGSLVLLAPFAINYLLFAWASLSRWLKAVLIFAVILCAAALVLLQSRGGALAFFIILLSALTLRWQKGWVVSGFALAGGGVLAGFLGSSRLAVLLSTGVSLEGLDLRREMWARALAMIQDFPFTGVGLGTFGQTVDALYPFSAVTFALTPHAHNLILQIAVDLGIPGLIAWLAMFILAMRASWVTYRRGKEENLPYLAGLGAALLGSGAAVLVHGMIDSVVWGMVRPALLVWGLWGIATAAMKFSQVSKRV